MKFEKKKILKAIQTHKKEWKPLEQKMQQDPTCLLLGIDKEDFYDYYFDQQQKQLKIQLSYEQVLHLHQGLTKLLYEKNKLKPFIQFMLNAYEKQQQRKKNSKAKK